jgi:CrcB protein
VNGGHGGEEQLNGGAVDDHRNLPADPDVAAAGDQRGGPVAPPSSGPFAARQRSRLPPIHWPIVAAVAGGGVVGGILRYLVTLAWPAPAGTVPWAVLTINTAGGFILALLLVLVLEVLPPTTYLRPALGTGFCGALTTFSSVATQVDQLVAGGHPGTAAGYVGLSLAAGLGAASFGIVLGRAIAAHHGNGGE